MGSAVPQSLKRTSVRVSVRGLIGGRLAPVVKAFQKFQTSLGSVTKPLPLDGSRLVAPAAGAAAAGAAAPDEAAGAADASLDLAAGAAETFLCPVPLALASAAGAALSSPAGGGALPCL